MLECGRSTSNLGPCTYGRGQDEWRLGEARGREGPLCVLLRSPRTDLGGGRLTVWVARVVKPASSSLSNQRAACHRRRERSYGGRRREVEGKTAMPHGAVMGSGTGTRVEKGERAATLCLKSEGKLCGGLCRG